MMAYLYNKELDIWVLISNFHDDDDDDDDDDNVRVFEMSMDTGDILCCFISCRMSFIVFIFFLMKSGLPHLPHFI